MKLKAQSVSHKDSRSRQFGKRCRHMNDGFCTLQKGDCSFPRHGDKFCRDYESDR